MSSSIGGVIGARWHRVCQVPSFDDGRRLIENQEIPHGEREYYGLSLSSAGVPQH